MYTLEHTQSVSPTAVICENLESFGGAPAKGEPDPRGGIVAANSLFFPQPPQFCGRRQPLDAIHCTRNV